MTSGGGAPASRRLPRTSLHDRAGGTPALQSRCYTPNPRVANTMPPLTGLFSCSDNTQEMFLVANISVKRLGLPELPISTQYLVRFMCRVRFDGMHYGVEFNVTQRPDQNMNVIWHYDPGDQLIFFPRMEEETIADDLATSSCLSQQFPYPESKYRSTFLRKPASPFSSVISARHLSKTS